VLIIRVCRPEHDKVHRLLADVVELVEVVLHDVPQLLHIRHLLVVLRVRPGITEVAEHEAAQVVLGHVTVAMTTGQVREQAVEIFVHATLCDVAHVREQPGAIVVVDQTVVEYTKRLRKTASSYSLVQDFYILLKTITVHSVCVCV